MPKLLCEPDTMFQLKSFCQPTMRGETNFETAANLAHGVAFVLVTVYPDNCAGGIESEVIGIAHPRLRRHRPKNTGQIASSCLGTAR